MNEPEETSSFWRLVSLYAESDDRGDDTLREDLKEEIRSSLSLGSDESVYLAKATSAGYRNQLWQGQALTQANELIVFVDKTGNPTGLSEAARKRLDPERRNGFDAIVICEPDGSGWRVHSVIEYENQELSKRLSQTFSGYHTVRVPDPAAWQGPQKEKATGDGNSNSSHLNNLLAAKNLILEGPPGTGKTHIALEIAREIAGANFKQYRMEEVLRGRTIEEVPFSEIHDPPLIWEMIQFHPSYSYEDFMRGIRTDPTSGEFELCAVDGILPQISKLARRRAGKPTLLILDELNRSNLSVVFGEAIFALDPAQRGRPIRLQYTNDGKDGDELIIPPDLLLIGTLNTADKSISAIDFATRRRFRFIKLSPSEQALKEYYDSDAQKHKKTAALMRAINLFVKDKDLLIGHSYFMHSPSLAYVRWAETLSRKLALELVPLLAEYANEGVLSERERIEVLGMTISLEGNDTDKNAWEFNRHLNLGAASE